MASYHQSTNKRLTVTNGLREIKNCPTGEQKAAHVELLLRRLYAKVDELEAVCKEEKDFFALLKRKGRKTVPKFDSQLMPRVVASQQRCAELAFNNLDVLKRSNRTSVRKVSATQIVKEKECPVGNGNRLGKSVDSHWNWNKTAHPVKEKAPDPVPVTSNEPLNVKENSWYGSLDRNVKKKKRGFLDRSRRHTKTVGSLAGLDTDNIEMLQPDEQYTFGLPPVDTKFDGDVIVKASVAPAIPQRAVSSVTSNVLNSSRPPPHDLRNMGWQLAASHSYTRSQPVPVFHASSVDRETSTWFDSSVDTVDSALGSSEVLLPTYSTDVVGATDVNFNRLAISSPTEASERSSRSSENGDMKTSFLNESSKPFEMSDYYKYSTKYRSQKREKVATSKKPEAPKIHRVNGTTNLRQDVVARPCVPEVKGSHPPTPDTTSFSLPDETEPVPKLPPKLRPILNGCSVMNNSALTMPEKQRENSSDILNGNSRNGNQEAWMQNSSNCNLR
ncbi:unnamed protein product [Allacma fusca]|uniref:Uncharacterized protein n=1 Tax=Allacma fusca TaxID=39272 RepID=A0A8J2NGG6_9HEXA|nr:unnamed protein product [Allacma fusca]